MHQLYDFDKHIIVAIIRITPNLIEFLQDDFNFELTLRLVDDLHLQNKIQQLKPPFKYKQLITVLFTRFILNKALGNGAFDKVSFVYNKYGKPCIEGVEFNTSSSNDVIAIALHSSPIGIDLSHAVQNVSPKDYKQQYEPIFHSSELSQVDSYFKFNHFWTLKEAFTKLIGCGLNVELSDFYFTLSVEEFAEDEYCLGSCLYRGNESTVVDVSWYDKITVNADKLFQENNEFVGGLVNEFHCYSTVIEKEREERLPVICSVITQQPNTDIKTIEVDFLTVLQQQLQNHFTNST